MKNSKAFSHFAWVNGLIGELDRVYPSYLSSYTKEGIVLNKPEDTHYIYNHKGICQVLYNDSFYYLHEGEFACVPGSTMTRGGEGIIISRENSKAMFQIGGPVEHEGRLKYIDGCTDTCLIQPWKLGEPCLNLLYFPEGIDQTEHTHPSDRIGMVLSGKGECVAMKEDGTREVIQLEEGMIFCIHTDGLHKFRTLRGSDMRVLAYHPDSDFGPTDENHPMINKTIVNGVSASLIDEIRTQ